MDSRMIVGMLANENRFKVVASITLGRNTFQEIGDITNLNDATVKRALAQLIESELINKSNGDTYILNIGLLRDTARGASRILEDVPELSVIDRYIKNGQLASWPRKRDKRLKVLEHISNIFEYDMDYRESEINQALSTFNSDYATIRRYLIDEGFLARENRLMKDGRTRVIYWRVSRNIDRTANKGLKSDIKR